MSEFDTPDKKYNLSGSDDLNSSSDNDEIGDSNGIEIPDFSRFLSDDSSDEETFAQYVTSKDNGDIEEAVDYDTADLPASESDYPEQTPSEETLDYESDVLGDDESKFDTQNTWQYISEDSDENESDESSEEQTDDYSEDNNTVYDISHSHQNSWLSSFKIMLAKNIDKISKVSTRKKVVFISLILALVAFAVLVFTDIIPLLPNSYHRSYVGRSYNLGETRNCVVERIGDDVIYASDGRAMRFGPDMKLISSIETFPGKPVVRSFGNSAIVYTHSGNNALIIQNGKKQDVVSTTSNILSAYVASSGAYTLVTKDVSTKTCLSAYSDAYQTPYKWHSPDYIIDSAITDDATRIAAAIAKYSETSVYTNIVFINPSEEKSINEVEITDNLITEICFVNSKTLVAFGDSYTVGYTPEGIEKWRIDYKGKTLKTYDYSDEGNIAFLFNSYNSELSDSTVEIYGVSGRKHGSYHSEKNIKNVSVNNDYCLLVLDGKTVLLNSSAKVKKTKKLSVEYSAIELYENYNFAFGVSDNIAKILSVKH